MSYQKCPICGGTGTHHYPPSMNTSEMCKTCDGRGIISTVSGLPPQTRVAFVREDNISIIDKKDIKIEIFRSSGRVSDTSKAGTAVRMTHLPTGITVECSEHRHQYRNRKECYEQLEIQIAKHKT